MGYKPAGVPAAALDRIGCAPGAREAFHPAQVTFTLQATVDLVSLIPEWCAYPAVCCVHYDSVLQQCAAAAGVHGHAHRGADA